MLYFYFDFLVREYIKVRRYLTISRCVSFESFYPRNLNSTESTRTYTHTNCKQKDLSSDYIDQDAHSEEKALTLAGHCRRTDELYGQDSANQKKFSGTTALRRNRTTFDTG